MQLVNKKINSLRTLVILTLLLVMAQIAIVGVSYYVAGILSIAKGAIVSALHSGLLLGAQLHFLISQLIIYSVFVYFTWYIGNAIGELFSLSKKVTYYLTLLFWLNCVIALFTLNTVLVPHSYFTSLILHNLLRDTITNAQLKIINDVFVCGVFFGICLALVNMCMQLIKRQHLVRHCIMLAFIVVLTLLSNLSFFLPKANNSFVTTAKKPNIIIIGFDALRPDYLSYFNSQRPSTPNFDAFLKSAIVFKDVYTVTARTAPSWAALLTARYPLYNGIRENNADLGKVYTQATLAKQLQQAGYETIYAADDRRFNNIDQRYGFDKVIGPSGNVSDYFLGSINDFPLTNLLATTAIGKLLFPYSHANHGSAWTYNTNNFLSILSSVLQNRKQQPLFLAVHFDLSGWPFIWFNDKLPYDALPLFAYGNAVVGSDDILKNFLGLLKQNKLLDNTIVVLLSDHGITLGLPNDRDVNEKFYQGDKDKMFVKRYRYALANGDRRANDDVDTINREWQQDWDQLQSSLRRSSSAIKLKDYGIDTSYNYGGDVLSLKQFRPVLAFKAYGFELGTPHEVSGISTLLDIAPTLLDILRLVNLPNSDGISLKPYLNSKRQLSKQRALYLESNYGVSETDQSEIVASKVAAKNVSNFIIDDNNGLLTLDPGYMKILIGTKQRAILQGDWLLAYYPMSERFRVLIDGKEKWRTIPYHIPPYFVLLNLKTHQWTTQADTPLAHQAPLAALKRDLNQFFGHEMDVYSVKN